jgi:hypothetical protein
MNNSCEPAEFVREMLRELPLHSDLEGGSLIDKMLSAAPGTDPWSLDLTEEERHLLGRTLAENPETPTIAETQSALAWLGRRRLGRLSEQLNQELRSAGARSEAQAREDPTAVNDLLLIKRLLRRATRSLEGI